MDKILQIQDAMNRRTFLQRSAAGLGLAALAAIFGDEGFAATPRAHSGKLPLPLGLPGLPRFPAKAKRVIYLFQSGAPSQIDLFDYKPKLEKYGGKICRLRFGTASV